MKNIVFYEDYNPTIFQNIKVKEKSPFHVLVVVTFKKNGEVFKMMSFPTDYNVFATLLKMVRIRCHVFPKLTSKLLNLLATLATDKNATEEELCPLVLKCICCNVEGTRVYSEITNQSIGFRFTVDTDNPFQSKLWGSTAEEIGITYEAILNQIKPKNHE